MTKAWIFDETVAKGLPVTGLKVISIVVDYSAKMEALLLEMRQLMVGLHPPPLPTGSIDLADFPELLAAEILQGLSTPTKGPVNQTTSPIPPTDLESDTKTRPTDDLPPRISLFRIHPCHPEPGPRIHFLHHRPQLRYNLPHLLPHFRDPNLLFLRPR